MYSFDTCSTALSTILALRSISWWESEEVSALKSIELRLSLNLIDTEFDCKRDSLRHCLRVCLRPCNLFLKTYALEVGSKVCEVQH